MRTHRPARRGNTSLVAIAVSIAAALSGCGSDDTPHEGGPHMANVQDMQAAWQRGTCPDSIATWSGFDDGVAEPSGSAPAPAGQRETMVTGVISRILICQSTGSAGALTGSALITDPATITRLRADLNAVTASNGATCIGTGRILLLIGDGANVASIDMSYSGCPFLNNSVGVADFGATSLEPDLEAAIAKYGPALTPRATPR